MHSPRTHKIRLNFLPAVPMPWLLWAAIASIKKRGNKPFFGELPTAKPSAEQETP